MASLGSKLTGKERRDAIHIAIAPVQAGGILVRGIPARVKDGKAVACTLDSADGIVDPFLDERFIQPGEWVCLCMKPDTVVNLRHEWDHHAFNDKEASRTWLEMFAKNIGMNFDELIETLKEVNATGRSHTLNSDTPDVCYTQRAQMWYHFSMVTGIVVNEVTRDESAFGCAC